MFKFRISIFKRFTDLNCALKFVAMFLLTRRSIILGFSWILSFIMYQKYNQKLLEVNCSAYARKNENNERSITNMGQKTFLRGIF